MRMTLCTTSLSLAICSTLALAASTPQKPAAAAKLPATVAGDLDAMAEQCREAGGKPLTDAAIKRADLNADGKEDFVLDVGSINCDGAASIYGDREKGVTVYVGDGNGGATNAFSEWVFGATIEGTGPAAKLWLTVSGEACGKKRAADFASENFCDRAIVWNAKTKKFEFAPVATVRAIK
jgi:hypothetical protein